MRVSLFIVNRTDQPVTIDPDDVVAVDMLSKQLLKHYSPAEIEKKINRSANCRRC